MGKGAEKTGPFTKQPLMTHFCPHPLLSLIVPGSNFQPYRCWTIAWLLGLGRRLLSTVSDTSYPQPLWSLKDREEGEYSSHNPLLMVHKRGDSEASGRERTKPWPAQREHWQRMKRHGAEILPLRGRQYSWPTRRCDGLWPQRYRPSRERFHNVTNILASFALTSFFLSSSEPLSSLFMDTSSGFSGSGLFQLHRHKARSEPYGQHNHYRTKASRPRIIYRLEPIIR